MSMQRTVVLAKEGSNGSPAGNCDGARADPLADRAQFKYLSKGIAGRVARCCLRGRLATPAPSTDDVVLALEVGQWYWRGDAYGCGRVGSSVHLPG